MWAVAKRLHFGENLPRAPIESCSEIFILANSRNLRWAKERGAILWFHNEALLEMYPNEFSLQTFLHLEWPLFLLRSCEKGLLPQQQQSKLLWNFAAQGHSSDFSFTACWIWLKGQVHGSLLLTVHSDKAAAECLQQSEDDQKTEHLALCLLPSAKMLTLKVMLFSTWLREMQLTAPSGDSTQCLSDFYDLDKMWL